MKLTAIVLAVLTVVFFGTTLFLLLEYRKKFGFMRDFLRASGQVVEYDYPGAEKAGIKRGMKNIVLRSDHPFATLIGFKLIVPIIDYEGFDYYGFMKSKPDGHGGYIAVMSTFFGTGEVVFQFLTTITNDKVSASSTEADQALEPDEVYPPHFYQRIGFYG